MISTTYYVKHMHAIYVASLSLEPLAQLIYTCSIEKKKHG